MSDKVKIDKISLTIGGKVVELTLEQAKELKAVLSQLFQEPEIKIVRDTIIERDRWINPNPWVQPMWPASPSWEPTITYCGDSATLCLSGR